MLFILFVVGVWCVVVGIYFDEKFVVMSWIIKEKICLRLIDVEVGIGLIGILFFYVWV